MTTTRLSEDVWIRFWTKVDRSAGTEGCWPWLAYKKPEGYGHFRIGRDIKLVHRISYEMLIGAIPEGLQLDHLCRIRSCVNPLHLEPVTNKENVLRGEGITAKQSRQTHCLRGHE